MSEQKTKVLFVDDEASILSALRRLFWEEEQLDCLYAEGGENGLQVIAEHADVAVVVSDYRMPGMSGVEFLRQVKERLPDTVRMVLSGFADTGSIVEAINEGHIYKFIPKPWNDDELKVTIAKAVELYHLQQKNVELARSLQQSNDELRQLNANLERLVEERTSEVVFRNRLLTAAQNILDSLPVAVLGIAMDGMVALANRQAALLFSCAGAGPIGLSVDDRPLLPVLPLFRRVVDDGAVTDLVDVDGKNYAITGSSMRFDNGQQGVVLVFVGGDTLAVWRK